MRSGTSRNGRLTEWRTVPVDHSTIDGSPMHTAVAAPQDSICPIIWSSSAFGLSVRVGTGGSVVNVPSSSTVETTFVPPTSIPMKRSPLTATVPPPRVGRAAR